MGRGFHQRVSGRGSIPPMRANDELPPVPVVLGSRLGDFRATSSPFQVEELMAYTLGLLEWCIREGCHDGPSIDSRVSDYSLSPSKPLAYLPHSCSEWVIGSPQEAKALIEDLYVFIEAAATDSHCAHC